MGKIEKTIDTAAQDALKSVEKSALRTIEALMVRSVAKSFRSIGMAFTREAVHLDPTVLTQAQIDELLHEQYLVVTRTTVTVPADAPVSGSPVVTPVSDASAASSTDAGDAK